MNKVLNRVTLVGPAHTVETAKAQLNEPARLAVMNGTYPTDGDTPVSVLDYPNPIFSLWNIFKPSIEILDTYKESWEWTKKWNLSAWGTEVDVMGVSVVENSPRRVTFEFESVDYIPEHALRRLSRQVPDLSISYKSSYESGAGESAEFYMGRRSLIEKWPVPRSHKAFEGIMGKRTCSCERGPWFLGKPPFIDCLRAPTSTHRAVSEMEEKSHSISLLGSRV